ncbi:aminoglycoside phosphotransferase family protein [Nonomuraea polychroma]|uniref:aminoglycoside phosphotransferase family protein n=1 Tax=Nonomuraea polychroma TaxID=46176 RepID=UPI003D8B84C2
MEISLKVEAAHVADPWAGYFAERGHPGARRIGAGVEGVVYRLGDGQVAKVWTGRPPTELTRQVYADIAQHRLPFATPEIFEVHEHESVVVTYERELPGVPMRGDDRPLWQGHDRFQDALAALVVRAADRHGAALAVHVPEFSAGVERTLNALRSITDAPVTAIHGDLVPPNIHTDAAGRPVAVLDFGFYTTAGDPAFEAAVTAAVWDMYGPYAGEHTAELTRFFAQELGYPPAALTTYQAVYALTTYDLFGMDDKDGHFRWCAEQLRRNTMFSTQMS